MEEKKSFGASLEAFFAGKGFYIVLFLCMAVIGVSAWVMLTEKAADTEVNAVPDLTLSDPESYLPVGKTESEALDESALAAAAPESVPVREETAVPVQEVSVSEEPVQQTAAVSAPTFFIWPVSGEVENAYSMTALQYNRTMKDWRTHDGLDIAAELGAQVKATTAGSVAAVYADERYGTTVVIEHGAGLVSSYSNLAATPTVKVGDHVVVGQIIGSVGDTALCESAEVTHLHFAMALEGESVDPGDYLP